MDLHIGYASMPCVRPGYRRLTIVGTKELLCASILARQVDGLEREGVEKDRKKSTLMVHESKVQSKACTMNDTFLYHGKPPRPIEAKISHRRCL